MPYDKGAGKVGGMTWQSSREQGKQEQFILFVILHCFHLQASGMAEGTVGTIATLVGGLVGIAVLAYLASSV